MAPRTWIRNDALNDNVGPRGGLGSSPLPLWADTNGVIAHPGQVMTGFALYDFGTRLMPWIQTAVPGQNAAWQPRSVYAETSNVIPSNRPQRGCSGIGDSGNCTMYVDTTLVVAPRGQVAIGAALMLTISNRVAPALLCVAASDLSGGRWVYNTVNNGSYFERDSNLGDYYIDFNPVVAPPGAVVTGLALYRKGKDRIAPKLSAVPWSTLSG